MLNKGVVVRIGDWIRPVTIGSGVVAFLVLALLDIVREASDDGVVVADETSLGESIFGALVFGAALIWFAFNGLRWLQERLLPPFGWLALGALALTAFAAGGGGIFFGVANLTDESNLAENQGVIIDVYQIALGSIAVAIGVLASASALIVYARETDATTLRVRGFMRRVAEPPHYEGSSDRMASVSRWLAVAGGVLFALSTPVSPVVIPIAVALTCLVRYVATLPANDRVRMASAIGVAVILVAIQVQFALSLSSTEALLGWIGTASTVAMIAALAVSLMNRRMSDDLSSVGVTAT